MEEFELFRILYIYFDNGRKFYLITPLPNTLDTIKSKISS